MWFDLNRYKTGRKMPAINTKTETKYLTLCFFKFTTANWPQVTETVT